MVVAIRDGLVARIQFAPIQALGEPLKIWEGHESKQILARESVGFEQPDLPLMKHHCYAGVPRFRAHEAAGQHDRAIFGGFSRRGSVGAAGGCFVGGGHSAITALARWIHLWDSGVLT